MARKSYHYFRSKSVHKQNAAKQFTDDILFFVYDVSGRPVMRISLAQLPHLEQVGTGGDIINLVVTSDGEPLIEGSRVYLLAQHVYRTATLTELSDIK